MLIFFSLSGMQISRPYTVVLPSLQVGPTERENDGQRFYLMIKIYPGGTLTPTLSSIEAGQLSSTDRRLSGRFWLLPVPARDVCVKFQTSGDVSYFLSATIWKQRQCRSKCHSHCQWTSEKREIPTPSSRRWYILVLCRCQVSFQIPNFLSTILNSWSALTFRSKLVLYWTEEIHT